MLPSSENRTSLLLNKKGPGDSTSVAWINGIKQRPVLRIGPKGEITEATPAVPVFLAPSKTVSFLAEPFRLNEKKR